MKKKTIWKVKKNISHHYIIIKKLFLYSLNLVANSVFMEQSQFRNEKYRIKTNQKKIKRKEQMNHFYIILLKTRVSIADEFLKIKILFRLWLS